MKALYLIAAAAAAAAASMPATAAAATKASAASFGCEARSGQVCHFLIFYPARQSRNVVLPAGMTVSIPDVRIGQDSYCVAVNKPPPYPCKRKLIGANSNS